MDAQFEWFIGNAVSGLVNTRYCSNLGNIVLTSVTLFEVW